MSWIRLDIDYDRTDWLRREKRLVKAAWPDLLRLIKREAPVKARIKFRGVDDLAYAMHYDSDEAWAIERLLVVAQEGNAIVIEKGELFIQKWDDFQSPEATRSRSKRANEGIGENDYEEPGSDPPRNGCVQSEPVQTEYETGLGETDRSTLDTDRSTLRLKRSRASRDTATQQQIDKSISLVELWADFVATYPKRNGDLCKSKAREKFQILIRNGVDPAVIMSGVKAYRAWCDAEHKTGTGYVAMMTTWLHGERWTEDYDIRVPTPNGKSNLKPITCDPEPPRN